ncbi:MAG: tetratricopeptide repeat protein [Bacteroidia bacterium]
MANTHIFTFIQYLTEIETRIAEDHLSKSQGLFANENGTDSKELALFKYLIANRSRTVTDKEVTAHLDVKDLSHLKTHLYNKVLESLSHDKFITNASVFNSYDTAVISLKKQLLIIKISLRSVNEGKTEALKDLLNNVIDKAFEYEAYDTLVEALTAKKYFISIREGQAEFDKINRDIEFYSDCVRSVFFATDCYYRIIINNDFIKSFSEKELDKFIRSSIKQLEKDFKRTNSQQINYYLHILLFAESERSKNFKKAIKQCNELLNLLKMHKVIYRRERVGTALLNLSEFMTRAGDYKHAAENAKKAKDQYPDNSFEQNVAIKQEFLACFYGKDYQTAKKCLDLLLNQPTEDAGEFRKSKYIFYNAWISFAKREYKEALALLNTSLEIEKDKSRWNISVRILHILLFIELNKIDEAGNALESLRKYMERTGKEEEIRGRDAVIVKFLREIEKDGFQYDPSNITATKMLNDLSDRDSNIAWETYSAEMIPFQDWVTGNKVR